MTGQQPEGCGNAARGSGHWRRSLGAELGWILVAKLCALTLLWALFFRSRS